MGQLAFPVALPRVLIPQQLLRFNFAANSGNLLAMFIATISP
jgi:hypothetical protein